MVHLMQPRPIIMAEVAGLKGLPHLITMANLRKLFHPQSWY